MELNQNPAVGEGSSIGSGVKKVGEKLAAAMDKSSERLLSGADALEGQALSAAVKLSDGAKFVRDSTSGDVVKDCCSLVVKYPFHALVAGAFAGLLMGRSIWRHRHS